MHPLAFYQKRIHLCVLAHGRAMFAHIADMTPARFDILYVMYKLRPKWARAYPTAQATLTERLGLSRQTIWKAVERLIELGWVAKKKAQYRTRQNVLTLTEEGVRRIRQALNAAFSERRPLPLAAPALGDVPRYWRRPELADPPDLEPPPAEAANSGDHRATSGEQQPLATLGRDVERIFTKFVWHRIGRRGRTGRRGKRAQHLNAIDNMIDRARDLARAFGNEVTSIYTLRFTEENDH